MAKKRIDKYINIDPTVQRKIDKIKEEVVIMAATKTEKVEKDWSAVNIYAKLIEARKMFLESGVKKSGVNRFAEFKYFTLEDIIPVKQKIFRELGLLDTISFEDDRAILLLTNVDKPEEMIIFASPLEEDESLIKNPIQKLGAVQTYVRRYLYMTLLDITEADTVDAVSDKPTDEEGKPTGEAKKNRPVTPEKREEAKKELINQDGEATATQIKSIKTGLKKLREKNDSYEGYITDCVKKIKAGLTKTDAENLLIEIGDKIEE